MSKENKIKSITKGSKSIQQTAQQGKNLVVKSKERVQKQLQQQPQTGDTPTNHAIDEVSQGVNKAVEMGKKAFHTKRKTKTTIKEKQAISPKAKENIMPQKSTSVIKKPASKQAVASQEQGKKLLIKQRQQAQKSSIRQSAKTVPKGIKATGKETVKTAKRSVKTAQATAKTSIKTAQQATKATKQGAKLAAKTAKKSAQIAKATAKATAKGLKVAAKAVIYAIKAAIAGARALIAVIASGGGVVIAILLAVVILLMIVSSSFGIFFSSDANSGEGAITIQQAVQEINRDYLSQIENIKQSNAHDEVEMSGTSSVWKEVLAVYAVKVTTDPDNTQEVATLTPEKVELLREIFWDMNTLSYSTQTKEVSEIVVTGDGKGNLMETEVSTTKTILYIKVEHKAHLQAAEFYNFNKNQNELLAELMTPQYTELWATVLFGVSGGNGSGSIVEVALSQVGNVNGDPYWQWYGLSSRTEWCAIFVSWCAEQCGYLENGIIPKFAACQSQGVPWFKKRGLWQDRNYTPVAGDIIFFDWENDGRSDHVGIVEKVENGRVYTIEGNSGNACRQNSHPLGNITIMGYGTPQY